MTPNNPSSTAAFSALVPRLAFIVTKNNRAEGEAEIRIEGRGGLLLTNSGASAQTENSNLIESPANRGCACSKLIYPDTLKFSLILFSALSFLAYGAGCLFSAHMKREFERYRLGSQRLVVGALQWVAALGLLAGLSQPWMGRSAAAGLALMMLVAVGVRIRIKDSLFQTLPALFYLLLNAYLCLAAF